MNDKSKKKILVVDDEPGMVQILTHSLKKSGYDVISATRSDKGLELAKTHLPDFIIFDVMIPPVDGREAAKILTQHPPTSKIPIIFLTALKKDGDILELEGTDHHMVFSKPYNFDEMLKVIKNYT